MLIWRAFTGLKPSTRADGGMDLVFTADLFALDDLLDSWDNVYAGPCVSTDLQSWQWIGSYQLDRGDDEKLRFREYRFPLPPNASRLFVRTVISLSQDND